MLRLCGWGTSSFNLETPAVKRFVVCDIPDEYQPVADYLDEVKRDYPNLSYEILRGAIDVVELDGSIVAECAPVGGKIWRLTTVLGFGNKANLIFVTLRSGDFLAVHGFTSKTDSEIQAGTAIGIARKAALE